MAASARRVVTSKKVSGPSWRRREGVRRRRGTGEHGPPAGETPWTDHRHEVAWGDKYANRVVNRYTELISNDARWRCCPS